jgi:hypothetical protein
VSFLDIPGRAFLDTSVVNFILDYGGQIHDGMLLTENLNERIVRDINALYNIFLTGQRAFWQLAVSPYTYREVIDTSDTTRLYYLENWFFEVWYYWCDIINGNNDLPSLDEVKTLRTKFLDSGILERLPDLEDRILVGDAILYRCDCFCTRDWKTILRYRDELADLPLRILTPTEWWSIIEPFASL